MAEKHEQDENPGSEFSIEPGYMLIVRTNGVYNVYLPVDELSLDLVKSGVCIYYDPIRAYFIAKCDCIVPEGMVWAYKAQNTSVFYKPNHKVVEIDHLITGKLLPRNEKIMDDWKRGRIHAEQEASRRFNKNPKPVEPSMTLVAFQDTLLFLGIVVVVVAVACVNWPLW